MHPAATFPSRPDVLDLIVTAKSSAEVSIKPMVSAFGLSEALIFFYRGIPLGMLADLMPYHKAHGSFSEEDWVVLLAPSQRASIPFPEITPESFREALTQFLSSDSTDWTLICERDCDQGSMLYLQVTMSEAQNQLTELFRFVDGQPDTVCPTFVLTKRSKNLRQIT